MPVRELIASSLPRMAILLSLGGVFWLLEWKWPARPLLLRRSPQLRWDLLVVLFDRFVWVVALQWGSQLLAATVPDRPIFARANPWVGGALAIIGIDFLRYWTHRLCHSRLLWRVHRWHHMPSKLYWLSGHRATFFHQLIIGVAPLFVLTKLGILGFALSQTLFDVVAVWMGLFQTHFEHANIRVGGRALEWILVTPRFHRVHHARDAALYDANFGFGLTIWDRLFGTFADPSPLAERFEIGEASPTRREQMRAFLGF